MKVSQKKDKTKRMRDRDGGELYTVYCCLLYTSTYTELMPRILTSTLSKLGYTVIFKTNNRLWNFVRPVVQTNIESKTGIYKLLCDDCDRFYIGQMCIRDRILSMEKLPLLKWLCGVRSRNLLINGLPVWPI